MLGPGGENASEITNPRSLSGYGDLEIRVGGVPGLGNEYRVRGRVGDRSADRRDDRHINWGRKYRFPEYIRN